MSKPILAASAAIAVTEPSPVHAEGKPVTEKQWPAFEQAARELTLMRIEQLTSLSNTDAGRLVDPAQWMERRAAALAETGAAMKTHDAPSFTRHLAAGAPHVAERERGHRTKGWPTSPAQAEE